MRISALILVPILAAAFPAAGEAQEQAQERPFCVDRPGVNTPPCTLSPGTIMLETSLVDWTLDKAGGEREDTILVADTVVRVGVTESGELQIGLAPFGYNRRRTDQRSIVEDNTGVGDFYLAWRQNLSGEQGPIAVQAFVTLPIGSDAIGAGTWTAGVLVPMSFDLNDTVSFAATPEIGVQANESGGSGHFYFGSAVGLGFGLSPAIAASAELSAYRDDDPAGGTTQLAAAGSIAWQVAEDQQFDAQISLGLNRATPDLQLLVGLARRF